MATNLPSNDDLIAVSRTLVFHSTACLHLLLNCASNLGSLEAKNLIKLIEKLNLLVRFYLGDIDITSVNVKTVIENENNSNFAEIQVCIEVIEIIAHGIAIMSMNFSKNLEICAELANNRPLLLSCTKLVNSESLFFLLVLTQSIVDYSSKFPIDSHKRALEVTHDAIIHSRLDFDRFSSLKPLEFDHETDFEICSEFYQKELILVTSSINPLLRRFCKYF
ncbi:hypothetical protein GEMRC1_011890 [Eukaryota sp. GEM-RC1]